MSENTVHIPITQRLERLQQLYKSFSNDKNSNLCLWLLDTDEILMFEKFFKTETTILASSNDLFLKFQASFKNKKNYGKELVKELSEKVKNYNLQYPDKINWSPSKFTSKGPDSYYPIANWVKFSKSLKDLEGKLTIYLSPDLNEDLGAFQDWLAEAVEEGIPDVIQLMVFDYKHSPYLSNLANQKRVRLIDADLDMPQAMKEIAISTGGSDPGTQYQCHFIDLSKAATRGNVKKAQRHANAAMEIAIKENWKQLQIAVRVTMGSAFLNNKMKEEALNEYEEAELIARKSFENKEENAQKLLTNTLFSVGAALVHKKAFAKASEKYNQIHPLLDEKEDTYLLMEAYRMSGYCYEQRKNYSDAVKCYQRAIDIGAQLEADLRRKSTLPYIGKQIIRLNLKRLAVHKSDPVERQLEKLVGKDWKTLNPATA